MGIETSGRRPGRLSISNLSTGQSIEAQFNPTGLEESLEVNWARHTVPGLSHQPMHFVNTGNTKLTLELNFDVQDGTSALNDLYASKRFLQSLCYPRANASNVATGGPPRALFVWPGAISLTCVIGSLSFRYGRFNVEGTPVQFTARVTLEEIRDVRLTSEDVLRDGSRRSARAPEEP